MHFRTDMNTGQNAAGSALNSTTHAFLASTQICSRTTWPRQIAPIRWWQKTLAEPVAHSATFQLSATPPDLLSLRFDGNRTQPASPLTMFHLYIFGMDGNAEKAAGTSFLVHVFDR